MSASGQHEEGTTHDEIAECNWDNGLAPIWPVVDDPATEFGTTLLIYWRIDGPWLRENAAECNREVCHLCETLEQRLINGFCSSPPINYDQAEDNQLSAVQVHKLKQAGVPVGLIESERAN
jgi:hypothetical protein